MHLNNEYPGSQSNTISLSCVLSLCIYLLNYCGTDYRQGNRELPGFVAKLLIGERRPEESSRFTRRRKRTATETSADLLRVLPARISPIAGRTLSHILSRPFFSIYAIRLRRICMNQRFRPCSEKLSVYLRVAAPNFPVPLPVSFRLFFSNDLLRHNRTGEEKNDSPYVEKHCSNPNARRLIYAAAPFRTATLKTLTAFNFRWPSILFSLVWTTFSRSTHPFGMLLTPPPRKLLVLSYPLANPTCASPHLPFRPTNCEDTSFKGVCLRILHLACLPPRYPAAT